jgi:hypothetical protein
MDIQPVEDFLRLLRHRRVVEDAEYAEAPPRPLAAEEDVGGDVEVLGEGQVLVDRLDPLGEGVHRVLDRDGLPVHEYLPLVGGVDAGDHLDEGGLPGAVVAEDGEDLPPAQAEGYPVHGGETAESFYDVASLEQIGHIGLPPLTGWDRA